MFIFLRLTTGSFIKDNTQPLASKYPGGITSRNFDASISTDPNHIPFIVPLFVRGGAILPTIQQESFVGQLNSLGQPNPITYNIYPAGLKTMYYKVYLDDGVSCDSTPVGPEPLPKGQPPQPKVGDPDYDYDKQKVLEQNDVFPQKKKDPLAAGKYRRVLITHFYYPNDPLEQRQITVQFLREHDDGYTPYLSFSLLFHNLLDLL